ncbi:unnamed protein product [Moneuplotes crassus]|uniref:GAF domain-containing protein n=1 Tax=Euplotes crassus TaxID=5936 RepID=A0AAD2D7P7_EUPCR|nr:unnamed protein product [Moneuplotes crassus]
MLNSVVGTTRSYSRRNHYGQDMAASAERLGRNNRFLQLKRTTYFDFNKTVVDKKKTTTVLTRQKICRINAEMRRRRSATNSKATKEHVLVQAYYSRPDSYSPPKGLTQKNLELRNRIYELEKHIRKAQIRNLKMRNNNKELRYQQQRMRKFEASVLESHNHSTQIPTQIDFNRVESAIQTRYKQHERREKSLEISPREKYSSKHVESVSRHKHSRNHQIEFSIKKYMKSTTASHKKTKKLYSGNQSFGQKQSNGVFITVPPSLYDYDDKVMMIKRGIQKYSKRKTNMAQLVEKIKNDNKKLKKRIRIYNTQSPVKNLQSSCDYLDCGISQAEDVYVINDKSLPPQSNFGISKVKSTHKFAQSIAEVKEQTILVDNKILTERIQSVDEAAIGQKIFGSKSNNCLQVNAEDQIDLKSSSNFELIGSSKSIKDDLIDAERRINLTENQRMDDFLQTCLRIQEIFLFLETLVVEIPDRFDYIDKPNFYLVNNDALALFKTSKWLKKKAHRIRNISIKSNEWVVISEDPQEQLIPDESLFVNTKLFSAGKEYIYNKDNNYILLPVRDSSGELLLVLQIFRKDSPQADPTGSSRPPVLYKCELTLMKIFLCMVGSHIEHMVLKHENSRKNYEIKTNEICINTLLNIFNELSFIIKGQDICCQFMSFQRCNIRLLETSTNCLIFYDGKNDKEMFCRAPKNVGMIGMVLDKQMIYRSEFFDETMNHDSTMLLEPRYKNGFLSEADSFSIEEAKKENFTNFRDAALLRPCSVLCIPIFCEEFSKPIGAIQLIEKTNKKSICQEDITRVKALGCLMGSILSNICFVSERFRNFFEINQAITPVRNITEDLYNIFSEGSSFE